MGVGAGGKVSGGSHQPLDAAPWPHTGSGSQSTHDILVYAILVSCQTPHKETNYKRLACFSLQFEGIQSMMLGKTWWKDHGCIHSQHRGRCSYGFLLFDQSRAVAPGYSHLNLQTSSQTCPEAGLLGDSRPHQADSQY